MTTGKNNASSMRHSEMGKARRGYPENNKAKDGSPRYARDDVLIPKSFRAERSEVEESRESRSHGLEGLRRSLQIHYSDP